ncbi:MAG: hypothetical protein M1823_006202 [Watsoniomyces obsoletus]|nr:MAG: hypothetical protein M1823_006202 [Watsoniomyces obsoletus]
MPLTWSPLPYLYGDIIDDLSQLGLDDSTDASDEDGGTGSTDPDNDDPSGPSNRSQRRGQRTSRGSQRTNRSSRPPTSEPQRRTPSNDGTERRRFHLPPTAMDPGLIQRIEQWVDETNPRDPDRTDTYLDGDSEGNPSIHSSDEEIPNPEHQQESTEPTQRDTQGLNTLGRQTTPVSPNVDPELLRMMHPVQRAMATQREAAARERANERQRMSEAAKNTMDRAAIALAKSRGYVFDPMTGRPKQPDPPMKTFKRSPIRFTRGTETPVKSTSRAQNMPHHIGTIRHEKGESSGEQRGTAKPQPIPAKDSEHDESTKPPMQDPRKRRRTTSRESELRSNRAIERQLNFETEQARRYQEMEARTKAQQTQRRAATIKLQPQRTKTRSGKGKEREKKKDVARNPESSHRTDSIDLTKEPESG